MKQEYSEDTAYHFDLTQAHDINAFLNDNLNASVKRLLSKIP
jgi:hypothetical protein